MLENNLNIDEKFLFFVQTYLNLKIISISILQPILLCLQHSYYKKNL